jgi:hypothetical protein
MNGYEYVRSGPTQALDPEGTEIRGPREALSHYYGGGGFDETLSDELVDSLRAYEWHGRMSRRIERGLDATASGANASGSKCDCEKLIGKVWKGGDMYTQFSTGVHDPAYSFSLNTTIGTINSIRWDAEFEVKSVQFDDASGCKLNWEGSVLIEVEDQYQWQGGHNNMVRKNVVDPIEALFQQIDHRVLGTNYTIKNSWTEQMQISR